jgi:uncharacterized low-complexity protein
MTNARRIFVIRSLVGAGALAVASTARMASAQTQATVPDTDPQAVALGYKTVGSKTDIQA